MKHLGITAPSRSTVACVYEHRPRQLYQETFFHLLAKCRRPGFEKKKICFKNRLVTLDSTLIDLSLTLFDWAKFRRTKGAIKLHLLLDHDGYLPSFALVTEGKEADVKLTFPPGTIVVDDRAYNHYGLFAQWTAQGVFFATRLKDNALYEVVGERSVPQN